MQLTHDQAMDLLKLGLTWLDDHYGDQTHCGSMVFRALVQRQIITEVHRRRLASDYKLIGRILTEAHIVRLDSRPKGRKLKALCEGTDRHILMVVTPASGMLRYTSALGSNGYGLAVTPAGRQHAQSVITRYADFVTETDFLASYLKARSKLGRQMPDIRLEYARRNERR